MGLVRWTCKSCGWVNVGQKVCGGRYYVVGGCGRARDAPVANVAVVIEPPSDHGNTGAYLPIAGRRFGRR